MNIIAHAASYIYDGSPLSPIFGGFYRGNVL